MRCERMHATITVERCLANQGATVAGYNPAIRQIRYPGCWECPAGEAAARGELDDSDVSALRDAVEARCARKEPGVDAAAPGPAASRKRKSRGGAKPLKEHRQTGRRSGVLDKSERSFLRSLMLKRMGHFSSGFQKELLSILDSTVEDFNNAADMRRASTQCGVCRDFSVYGEYRRLKGKKVWVCRLCATEKNCAISRKNEGEEGATPAGPARA